MNSIIHQIRNPFPFLQIENLYNESELKLIWQELDFLNYPEKLKIEENIPLKSNKGLFLDTIYPEREISNILTLNSKSFDSEIVDAFSELSFGYQSIKQTNDDSTLISYYENADYYKPHEDIAMYTAVTWFFKEPKAFIGGDFYFSDYNVKIEVQNNMMILFPSFVKHSVDEITLKDKSLSGYGRYAMTQFLYITNKL
jgi:Rps23 Pro-64 3,4-dihydroxylase Tpa1-like proline 4-hydroxylase